MSPEEKKKKHLWSKLCMNRKHLIFDFWLFIHPEKYGLRKIFTCYVKEIMIIYPNWEKEACLYKYFVMVMVVRHQSYNQPKRVTKYLFFSFWNCSGGGMFFFYWCICLNRSWSFDHLLYWIKEVFMNILRL